MDKNLNCNFTKEDMQMTNMFRKNVQPNYSIRKFKSKSEGDNNTTLHLVEWL